MYASGRRSISIWARRSAARYLSTSALLASLPVDQEADHERRVEHLAEAERLRDVERHAPHGPGRHLPVQQRVQPLVRRTLERQADLVGGKHRLQGLQRREMAARVIPDADRHPGQVFRPPDRRLRRHEDAARRDRVRLGNQLPGPLARRRARGPVTGTAHARPVPPGPERLERAGLDLSRAVPADAVDSVVAAGDKAVLQTLGGEVVLLLRDPLLQPAMRHDLERHRSLRTNVDNSCRRYAASRRCESSGASSRAARPGCSY